MALSLNPQIYEVLSQHPHWPAVEFVLRQLRQNGHVAYLAGGCVRDALLGRRLNDMDVASSATPAEVEQLFHTTLDHGKSFGTIVVMQEGVSVEVTRFRKDHEYADGRHPVGVEFSDEQEDALRRDFTVNALFYDIEQKVVVDYVNGLEDLQKRTLRAVGDPILRFQEDHLRMLRALRFQSQLGFSIEEQTLKAISQNQHLILKTSMERILKEMRLLFAGRFFLESLKSWKEMQFHRFFTQLFLRPLDKDKLYDVTFWPEPGADEALFWFALFITLYSEGGLEERKCIIIFKDKFKLSTEVQKKLNSISYLLESLSYVKSLSRDDVKFQVHLSLAYQTLVNTWADYASRVLKYLSGFNFFKSDGLQFYLALDELCLRLQNQLPVKIFETQDFSEAYTGKDLGSVLKLAYALQLTRPDLGSKELVVLTKKVGPVL